jgi:hypothetical protein
LGDFDAHPNMQLLVGELDRQVVGHAGSKGSSKTVRPPP